MNKELTPIEELKRLKDFVLKFITNGLDRRVVIGSFVIIETALKRLEEIDKIFKKYDINDNWLDAALHVIKNHFPMNTEIQLKKLKALKIIKEKRVDVNSLLYYIKSNACDDSVVCWYNEYIIEFDDERILTHEDYDLLKEVLL